MRPVGRAIDALNLTGAFSGQLDLPSFGHLLAGIPPPALPVTLDTSIAHMASYPNQPSGVELFGPGGPAILFLARARFPVGPKRMGREVTIQTILSCAAAAALFPARDVSLGQALQTNRTNDECPRCRRCHGGHHPRTGPTAGPPCK